MIYSGVDLIRQRDQMAARADKVAGPKPTAAADPNGEDTKGALLRFARFINKERKKPAAKALPKNHPYHVVPPWEDRGRLLDIYV